MFRRGRKQPVRFLVTGGFDFSWWQRSLSGSKELVSLINSAKKTAIDHGQQISVNVLPCHYSDVIMSAMAFNSPASGVFTQPFFGRRSKKTPKLRVTGLCEGKSPGAGAFPAQRARKAENVSIWWRRHDSKALENIPFHLNMLYLAYFHDLITNIVGVVVCFSGSYWW